VIISGTYDLIVNSEWRNVQQQDVYLECDTSIEPVILNLFAIADLNRFWNVRLFISDIGNNASENNITINTGGSGDPIVFDTIDEQGNNQIILNQNGESAIIKVVSESSWIGIESKLANTGEIFWGQIGGTLSDQTDLQNALNAKQNDLGYTPQNIADKGQNNGYAGLDAGGKIPLSNLPNTLLVYKSVWSPVTNTPTLINNVVENAGFVYIVTGAPPEGFERFSIVWKTGDWLIYNDLGIIEKSDNSDDVVSVNGQVGIVVLTASDVGAPSGSGTSTNTNTGDQTFIPPRVLNIVSSSTVTATNLIDIVTITSQEEDLELANPTGDFVEGQSLIFRIKDDGVSRLIGYGLNFRAIGVTLPTATVSNKITYLGCIYNSTDNKFDIVGTCTEA
jgi:hypothetical protein